MGNIITNLSNGMQVITSRMPKVETVAISIWVAVGTRYENTKNNGISHLLEHMIFKGTEHRTAKDIAEAFDNIGGYLNAYTTREHTVYYCRVLKENIALAIEIMADMLQNSIMDEKELEREKGVVIQEIAQCNDTPDDIIFDYHQATAFGKRSVGRPVLGTVQSVKGITPSDLFEYVNNHYHPPNMLVSIAGNVTNEAALDAINEFFTFEPRGKASLKEAADYQGGECRKKRDLEQVHLLLGFKGLSYTDKNYYTLQLLSTILNGGMSSRLFQEVREKRGLAYAIHPHLSTYVDGGFFSIYAGTAADKASELIHVVCDQLVDITTHITQEELERGKAQLRAGLLMEYENVAARAEENGRQLLYLGKVPSPKTIISHIDAIDEAALKQLAVAMFQKSKPTLTSLGEISNVPKYEEVTKKLME